MPRLSKLIALAICLAGAPAAAADGNLLPSEVTVLINHAMRANPDVERPDPDQTPGRPYANG